MLNKKIKSICVILPVLDTCLYLDLKQDEQTIRKQLDTLIIEPETLPEVILFDVDQQASVELRVVDDLTQLHQWLLVLNDHNAEFVRQVYRYFETSTKALTAIHNYYVGMVDSKEVFARVHIESNMELDDRLEILLNYVDVQRYATDLFTNEFIAIDVDGQTHVFDCF